MQQVIDRPTTRFVQRFTTSAESVAIELRDVTKRFGDVAAVNRLSLSVPAGQTIALLGPNGAGKSTAIGLMLGLRRPTSGEVRLFGAAPADPRARTRTGVMLQESGIPMQLRPRELIDLFRSYYPRPLDTNAVLEMADLGEKARSRAGDLSGGQRQRLYFALAVCGDPDLLFLDEPTAGLDVETRRGFWEQIQAFQRAGKTIVLTTHYLEEADALADRVVVIDKGRVVADDTPVAIKNHAAGKRVRFDVVSGWSDGAIDGARVEDFHQTGSSVSFLTNAPERALSSVFRSGAEIANLEVTGAGLEEAFIRLTHAAGVAG